LICILQQKKKSAIQEEHNLNQENKPETQALFFVRKDLKMGKGKIAAQCGHAALGIFKKILKSEPDSIPKWMNGEFSPTIFYCQNEDSMVLCQSIAESLNKITYVIHDAGRTQIAAGSATVLAIAPYNEIDFPSFQSLKIDMK
jgi:PTH2 family peptidyl-tRNA hydrolase